MNKPTLLLVPTAALAAALFLSLGTSGAPAAAGDPADGITVQGSAIVAAVPDRAEISFGVESPAQTAKAALAANAAEMRKVIAAIKAAGATEIKTQSISLSTRYTQNGEPNGFVAQNTVSAKVTNVVKAGPVIDAAVDAGANQVYGPSLTRSNQAELYRQALKEAVADARLRAQAIASAAGATLGKVTNVTEGGSGPQPLAIESQKAGVADSSTPIEPGTQEIGATVSVTFAIA